MASKRRWITYHSQACQKPALQAIYHVVTGKTESLSKDLDGNVIINAADIDRLYGMIIDQVHLYPRVYEPTTTIVVKHHNDKVVTYSSWERFKALRVNNQEITSDISLKLEFVLRLPDTPGPQRCTVGLTLDSSLPILNDDEQKGSDVEGLAFFFAVKTTWRTLKVSIDFVDFLVAKSFSSVAEEWFHSLKKCPSGGASRMLLKNMSLVRRVLGQASRLGMAAYLACIVEFTPIGQLSLRYVTLAVAFGFVLWSTIFIVEGSLTKRLIKRINDNIVPTIILLSEGDQVAYDKVLTGRSNAIVTVVNTVLALVVAIALNVIASYVYAYLNP